MTETIPGTPPFDRQELHDRWRAILFALPRSRAVALRVYEKTLREASTPVVKAIAHTFGPTMQYGEQGRRIREGSRALASLAHTHAGLNRDNRALLIENAAAELIKIGLVAEETKQGRKILGSIAAEAEKFALGGTAHQSFMAELATEIGKVPSLPETFCRLLLEPLAKALAVALGFCAPATRPEVMEGVGALLKHLPNATIQILPALTRTQCDTEGESRINVHYDKRRRRHELIVLAISGDPAKQRTFFAWLNLKTVDYDHRADFIRALPAICRQSLPQKRAATDAKAVEILIKAAGVVNPDIQASPAVQAAFARYQEIVFRTIDVMFDRGAAAEPFDKVTAAAVLAIRPTLVGPLEVCNAQARATMAVLRTAAAVAARLQKSETDAALEPLFRNLGGEWKEWMNPGILEGCLNSLPELLPDREHSEWMRAGVTALLQHLTHPADLTHLGAAHARLAATSAFRALLIAVAERLQKTMFHIPDDGQQALLTHEIEYTLRSLLAHPTAGAILDIFQKETRLAAAREMPRAFSDGIVSAVAFSSEVMARSREIFAPWSTLSAARQLLLVRILGLQLCSASDGRLELARCAVLRRIFDALKPVRTDDSQRIDALWQLLSTIAPAAAEAADADLQEFVDYSSSRSHMGAGGTDIDEGDDLSGAVLAMVSDFISYRIAADIARQVDLNRYRARLADPDFDFAGPLYQVMLRGPNVAIFQHLLARITEPRDRKLLLLLARHVKAVNECVADNEELTDAAQKISDLATHASTLIEDMEAYLRESITHHSATLTNLLLAMRRFVVLATADPVLWDVIAGKTRDTQHALADLFDFDRTKGGLEALFAVLDRLAADTPSRKALLPLCEDDCLQLRQHIEHYLSLSVGDFAACDRALRDAVKTMTALIKKIENDAGLQPPERIILRTLLRGWRDMFSRTIEWFVDAPRRGVHARKPKWFWRCIVGAPDAEPATTRWAAAVALLEHGQYTEAVNAQVFGRIEESELPLPPEDTRPPAPPGQQEAFEKFYVEWMASELDVDHLRWALKGRWDWFRAGYAVITRRRWVATLIALPCLVTIALHWIGRHGAEGILFFGYVIALFTLAITAFLDRRVKKMVHPLKEQRKQYRFEALLPRLFRLIIVPFALLVDFDHSYLFPIHASNPVLVSLMVMAFVTTSFFIRRELRAPQNEYSRVVEGEITENQGRRVGQIMSVALAHAFAAALVFSFIFEAGLIRRTVATDTIVGAFDSLLGASSGHTTTDLHHEYFLWILPKEARCDLSGIAHSLGFREEHAHRANVRFYPTLILSWTALGLFTGVFLEGFLRGERLRGKE